MAKPKVRFGDSQEFYDSPVMAVLFLESKICARIHLVYISRIILFFLVYYLQKLEFNFKMEMELRVYKVCYHNQKVITVQD